jgi:hypothetical protein
VQPTPEPKRPTGTLLQTDLGSVAIEFLSQFVRRAQDRIPSVTPRVVRSLRHVARNHVTPTKKAQQMFQKVSIPFWFNKGWSRLVAREIRWSLCKTGYGKNFATNSDVRQFHCPRAGVQENGYWKEGNYG